MNLKKIFVMAVYSVILLMLVTGCGSKAEDSQTTAAPKEQGQTQAEQTQTAQVQPAQNNAGEIKEPATIDAAFIKSLLEKGAKVDGIVQDMTITAKGESVQSTLWKQGGKVKISSTVMGEKMVTIMDGTSIITYYPDQKTGTKFVREKAKVPGLGGDDPSESFDESTLTFLEKGEYDGQACYIVAAKNKEMGTSHKLWISKKLGMMVKVESTQTDGTVYTTEFKNIKTGKLPDSTFEVPADIKIETMD